MRDVYLVAFAVTNDEGNEDAAGMLITAREGADENELGVEALALLPTTNIRKVNVITVAQVDNESLKAIGLIALAKGLI